MAYLKTQRKNKKPGEYKERISRRNKLAVVQNKMMDKMMWEAISRDKH